MRILVTAASKHGATTEIAAAIARVLAERGLEPDVVEPDAVSVLAGHDAVVLGSAVYAGHWLEPAKALVERLRDELAARPVWLFSSGPIGEPPRPEGDPVDVATMLESTGARDHAVFPGKLDRGVLGFAEKAIVLALRAPEGDFRDWGAIADWATGIADALQPETSQP